MFHKPYFEKKGLDKPFAEEPSKRKFLASVLGPRLGLDHNM
jgi:hypothetical protein